MTTSNQIADWLVGVGPRPKLALIDGPEPVKADVWTPEANTEDGLVPNSWVDEDGVRHAIVWQLDIAQEMRIVKRGSDWVIIDRAVF